MSGKLIIIESGSDASGKATQTKKLYERLGYQCVGQLPDFYKKGIDCNLMMKGR